MKNILSYFEYGPNVCARTLMVKICTVTSLTNNPVANLLRLWWNVQHVKVEDAPKDDVPAQVQLEFLDVDLIKVEPLLEDLPRLNLGIGFLPFS